MRGDRQMLWILGILLLLAAGLWLAQPGPGPAGDPAKDPAARKPFAPSDAGASGADAARPDLPMRSERTLLPEPTVALTTTTTAQRRVEVLLVAKATGKPVAGAELLYADLRFRARRLGSFNVFMGQSRDPDSLLRRLGTRARSDERGRAFLHLPEYADPAVRILAHKGDLFGYGIFPQENVGTEAGVWRLELEPDSTLRVQVVDGADEPLGGVSVALACEREVARGPADAVRQVWVMRLGKTGEGDGICTRPHVRFLGVRYGRDALGARPARPFIDIPGWLQRSACVDLRNPPVDPVVLTMPPTGSVRVRAIGPDGEALGAGKEVSLQLDAHGAHGPPRSAVRTRLPDSLRQRSWEQEVDLQGEARFVRVALDVRYKVVLDPGGTHIERVFDGPTRAGQELVVDLAAQKGSVLLTGRAVDRAGIALAERRLWAWLRIAKQVLWKRLRTNAEGRFEILVKGDLGAQEPMRLLAALVNEREEPTGIRAARQLGRLATGRFDLGDLRFAPAPLLLAGKVVDSEGSPLRVPDLRIEQLLTTGRWENAHHLRAQLDENMRFTFAGNPQPGRLRLKVRSRKHLPIEPIEFRRGTEDLLVRLVAGGSVEARLQSEPGVELDQVLAELVPEAVEKRKAGRLQRSSGIRGSPQGGGWSRGKKTFTWQALQPGVYRLELRCPGSEKPSLTLPGLVVPPGGPCADPRLAAIDLRDVVRRIRLSVVDGAGRPILHSRGKVLVKSGRYYVPPRSVRLIGGVADVVTTEPSISVLVDVPGYVPERVDGVTTDLVIELEAERSLRLRFQLVGGPPALPKHHELYVHLRFETRRRQSVGSAQLTYDALESHLALKIHYLRFDARGEAEIEVERLGTCRLGAGVRGPAGAAGTRGLSPAKVKITEQSVERVIELSLSDEQVAATLRRLQEKRAGTKGISGRK